MENLSPPDPFFKKLLNSLPPDNRESLSLSILNALVDMLLCKPFFAAYANRDYALKQVIKLNMSDPVFKAAVETIAEKLLSIYPRKGMPAPGALN